MVEAPLRTVVRLCRYGESVDPTDDCLQSRDWLVIGFPRDLDW